VEDAKLQGTAVLGARDFTGHLIKRLAKPMLTGTPWVTTLLGSTKASHLIVAIVDTIDTDSYHTPAVLHIARLAGRVLGNLWACKSTPVGSVERCQRWLTLAQIAL